MKQKIYNIENIKKVYEDIEYLDYRKLDGVKGDNLF